MSKIYVFTPTCRYGGVDVNFNSLLRQTEQDFCWIVLDDLFNERTTMWLDLFEEIDLIPGMPPARKKGDYRNLAAAYNAAVEIAVEDEDAELFVTMQDYMWLPEDGLEKFLDLHRSNPDRLLTGLCSISLDPTPDKVVDLEGHYTIFGAPYFDKPKVIDWADVREHSEGIRGGNHQEWEANWGAVPMDLLRSGLRWDIEYDRGVAYENQDFAIRALLDFEVEVTIDQSNHAITLPHKKYFPEEEKRDGPQNNKDWHEARWRDRGVIV